MEIENKKPLFYEDICELLPHRAPFLLIDRVIDYTPDESIHALKCISALEPYFAGHFPGQPIYPGVYLVEGLAQASGILYGLTMRAQKVPYRNNCLLTTIESARFRRPVVPGDVLHYYVKFEKKRGHFVWVTGEAKVNDEVVAEARFSALIGK